MYFLHKSPTSPEQSKHRNMIVCIIISRTTSIIHQKNPLKIAHYVSVQFWWNEAPSQIFSTDEEQKRFQQSPAFFWNQTFEPPDPQLREFLQLRTPQLT